MNNNINLTPAALSWIASGFEKKTVISPYANTPKLELTQEGLDDLIKQGIIDTNKQINAEAYSLLEILAQANKFASIKLTGDSGQLHRVTYWKEDKPVSFDNNGESFVISPGNDITALEIILSEIIGSNRLVSSSFSASFDHKTALVFAAILDLSRIASIRLYADDIEVPTSFSPEDISTFIQKAESTKWLTSHLKSLNIPGLAASIQDVLSCLKSLIENDIVAESNPGLYSVIRASAELAANFLFIENTLHFRAGSTGNDGHVSTSECVFLQAGLHDLIMLDVSAENIEISALSSYAVLEAIKHMMTTSPLF